MTTGTIEMLNLSDPTPFIHERCAELGFASSGVCAVEQTKWELELMSWLNDGRHGEMEYLARNVAMRIDPGKMVPGAKSIISVMDRYHSSKSAREEHDHAPRGRIASYAQGDDYHLVMKKRLHTLCDELGAHFPEETFRTCVDTAPVLEREHATRAGVGAIGKHTLLLDRFVGSYLLLGEVITTLRLDPSDSLQDVNYCGTCSRCIDACPTDAITPWTVDATKCISYLTIEHRGEIDASLHEAMGDWIFGCDICQEVCPHNHPTERAIDAPVHEAYASRREGFDLLEVLNWSEEDRRAAFARSSMKRAKLSMMKRNALIAAGNALRGGDHPALRARIEAIAGDEAEDDVVRRTAAMVSQS